MPSSAAANITPTATPSPIDGGDGTTSSTAIARRRNSTTKDTRNVNDDQSNNNSSTKKKKKKKEGSTGGNTSSSSRNTTPTVKHEATTKLPKSRKDDKYKIGSLLAIDLFGDDNYFEAELKGYNRSANLHDTNCMWVKLKYINGSKILKNDLNLLKVIDLSKHDVVEYVDEKTTQLLTDDERGYLGRRIIVQWGDGIRYPGMVIKYTKGRKNFVFIKYDDGDDCWFDLDRLKQKMNREEVLAAAAALREAEEEDEKANKGNNANGVGGGSSNTAKVKKELSLTTMMLPKPKEGSLEEKYPVGSPISVAYHHDDHFYDCIVKKHHNNTKVQAERGEEWVFVQFVGDRSKHWVDLNCINSVKILKKNIITLQELQKKKNTGSSSGYDGFLGQRIEIQWNDGNKYTGIATRMMKDDKHFVYMEYDDGDECWCNLRNEHDWNVIDLDDELNDGDDDDNDNGDIKMYNNNDNDVNPKKRKELFSSSSEEEEGDDDGGGGGDDDDANNAPGQQDYDENEKVAARQSMEKKRKTKHTTE